MSHECMHFYSNSISLSLLWVPLSKMNVKVFFTLSPPSPYSAITQFRIILYSICRFSLWIVAGQMITENYSFNLLTQVQQYVAGSSIICGSIIQIFYMAMWALKTVEKIKWISFEMTVCHQCKTVLLSGWLIQNFILSTEVSTGKLHLLYSFIYFIDEYDDYWHEAKTIHILIYWN